MSVAMEGTQLPEAATRLRMVLCLINTSLVLAGAALASLGGEIDRYIISGSLGDSPPPLWWLGVTPIVVGATGVVAAGTGRRKLVLAWVIVASVMGGGSYALLSVSGCLDSQQYGVVVQVYGDCQDHLDQCLCARSDGGINVLEFSTCEDVKHITTLYLALIAVLIFALGIGTTGTILGCVSTMCIQRCIPKHNNNYPYGGTTMMAASPVHATVHKSSSANSNSSTFESLAPSPLTEVSTEERTFTV